MTTIGFIGLGVMGGPMCRLMAAKHPGPVIAFDLSTQARSELSNSKAQLVDRMEDIWRSSDVVFMSLPGGPQVDAVCIQPGGLSSADRQPGTVVDLSTTSVATARKVSEVLAKKGVAFADAPVARTREAAQRGELSIMVGAPKALFDAIEPMLGYIGSDITHTGPVGSGQFAKLVNNALLDVSVIAIAECVVLAEKAGFDPALMIDAVSKGSGDSYALRNHAIKSILPRLYPQKSFPPEYKVKDLSYLLDLASELRSPARSMQLALAYYKEAIEAGYGGCYFTAVREVIEGRRAK